MSNSTVKPFALTIINEAVCFSCSELIGSVIDCWVAFEYERSPAEQKASEEGLKAWKAKRKARGYSTTEKVELNISVTNEYAAVTSLFYSIIMSYNWHLANGSSEIILDFIKMFASHVHAYTLINHPDGLRNAAIRALKRQGEVSEYLQGHFNLPTPADLVNVFGSNRKELEDDSFKTNKSELYKLAQIAGVSPENVEDFIKGTHKSNGDPKISAEMATDENFRKDFEACHTIKEQLMLTEKYAVCNANAKRMVGAIRRKYRDELQSDEAKNLGTAWAAIVPDLIKNKPMVDDLINHEFGLWLLNKLSSFVEKKGILWSTASMDYVDGTNASLLNPRPEAVDKQGNPALTKQSANHAKMYEKRSTLAAGVADRIDVTIVEIEKELESGPENYQVSDEDFNSITATRANFDDLLSRTEFKA